MLFCTDKKSEKLIYTDFVRDLRYDESCPSIYYPKEYDGQEVCKFCCTQHTMVSDYKQKKITEEWVDFLTGNKLPLQEVQFCTKTPEKIFKAICTQESIESLRFKWLGCKDINDIANLKNLKSLFIECGSSIEDLSPIAELENLEVLILGSTVKITDYTPLGKLKNLKVLGICSYQTRDDVLTMSSDEFIKDLTGLEYLELSDVKIHKRTFLMPENVGHLKYCRFRTY